MNERIKAGLIDFIITSIIQSVLIFIVVILPIFNSEKNVGDIYYSVILVTFISIIYLIIRDNIGSRSIGKRIFQLYIIDNNNNSLNFFKRLLRNITWILGPIEIISLIMTQKRIGDYISNSKIVKK